MSCLEENMTYNGIGICSANGEPVARMDTAVTYRWLCKIRVLAACADNIAT